MPIQPPPPLPVAIVWHQHQPQYPTIPGTRTFTQPWVRLHAAKDYLDMAAMVREFPGLKLTINLTPVLLQQLDAYGFGATDRHAQLALRPAEQLTPAERTEARDRFFQVSGPMLARHPRLGQLKALAPAKWVAGDYRDAAALFHLAWTDPDWLAAKPLAAIAAKRQGFTAADIRTILAEHGRLMRAVVPLHKALQDEGRIEVATTPFYHPILPLIFDNALAAEALPEAPKPMRRFMEPADARFHVQAAVTYYQRMFGRAPRGMWPGEGSVAQAVAPLFKEAGIRWIATDEDVLARTLGVKLRAGEVVSPTGAEQLYRAWGVKDGPAIVFRDRKLSDDIGFRYSKMNGEAAARDLLGQLGAIAQRPGRPDRLVTVILDGENAWENYPDDGKAFLRALYRGLTTDPRFTTTTPSEHLAAHTPAPLPKLWAGSWIGASFATWIGEDEENRAWDLLAEARAAATAYAAKHGENAGYKRAMTKVYAAEGSDWFWWYGRDQDSGRDSEFDQAYRDGLAGVYRELGQQPPAQLAVPLVAVGAMSAKQPQAYLAPLIDGPLGRTEWARAGSLFADGGAMAQAGRAFDALFYGWDKRNLYLAVQHGGEARGFELRIGTPGVGAAFSGTPFAVHAVARLADDGTATLTTAGPAAPPVRLTAGHGRGSSEVAIPWAALGVRSGDALQLQLAQGGTTFPARPLALRAPVLSVVPLVTFADAPDQPGYTLPTGGAYTAASVDLQALEIGEEDGAWAFTWKLGGVRDPWGSPIGLSLVALDLYLGTATAGAATPLLDGREALGDRPWTHALAVEGWQQGLFAPDGTKRVEPQVAVDPLSGEVRARVPKTALPGHPRDWRYLATLAGQDGFAPGRIRQVGALADAERFGGRAAGLGSNLLDVLQPDRGPDPAVLPYLAP